MNFKEQELERLGKTMTHLKRYEIVGKKLADFVSEIEPKGHVEDIDKIKYGEILEESYEALLNIYTDASEELNRLNHTNTLLANALLHYTKKYGDTLTIERISNSFTIAVDIAPLENELLSITVRVYEHEVKRNNADENKL